MRIDNFELITDFIKDRFLDENSFYFVQIIQRKKDFSENVKSVRVLKSYYVYDVEYLEKKKEEIINLCEENKAMAYININARSAEAVGFKMMKEVADALYNRQFKSIRKLYDSCCGQICSAKEKLWTVDIDCGENIGYAQEVAHYINSQQPLEDADKIKLVVNTRHGLHLLTKPFDRRNFNKEFPDIDLHKDNPTILYFPNSIDNETDKIKES